MVSTGNSVNFANRKLIQNSHEFTSCHENIKMLDYMECLYKEMSGLANHRLLCDFLT